MNEAQNLSEAVRNLQTYLRALSYEDSRIERVPVDGIFGDSTRRALTEFQRTRGFDPTGVADRDTYEELYDEYLELLEETVEESRKFFPTSPNGYEASPGEEHAFVSFIQFLLKELEVVYPSNEELKISGVYDAPTEAAVRRFQAASLLPVTGKVDLRTWNRLTGDFEAYAGF